MHIHIHLMHDSEHGHPHGHPLSRVTRDLDSVVDWLIGPGMSQQQRSARNRAEAQNEKYGSGIM